MVEVVKSIPADEWHDFLQSQADATLYHTPEWGRFLEVTFGYKSQHRFATDESGQLIGMLPLFEVRSRLTGNRLCSVPFSHCCGPIGDTEAVCALLKHEMDSFDASEMDFIEVRSRVRQDHFEAQASFLNYRLDLSDGLDQVWTGLKRDVRRGINKAEKAGVQVAPTRDLDSLKAFYELNCVVKRDIGVPAHPWKFFRNLFEYLGDYAQLFLARYGDEIIGGWICEYYRSEVLSGYSASNGAYVKFYPDDAMSWASIQDACLRGYTTYDLGRTSCENAGLRFYKSRWGAVERELIYSYFPRNPVTLSGNRSGLKYRVATSAVQKMPIPLHKAFSGQIFRHFG